MGSEEYKQKLTNTARTGILRLNRGPVSGVFLRDFKTLSISPGALNF